MKSDFVDVSPVVLRFADGNSTLVIERNVQQSMFREEPTAFVAIVMDDEPWYMPKSDAQRVRDWLTEALK